MCLCGPMGSPQRGTHTFELQMLGTLAAEWLQIGCKTDRRGRSRPLARPNRVQKFGGPEGIRTPDLLNAMPTVDRPPESTRVVVEFKSALCPTRSVHQGPP
jgi:hypothetical protein